MARSVLDHAQLERLRALADSLDCVTDEDLQLLGDLTGSTTSAWRKRGTGPEYILLGNRALYPRKPLAAFLEARRRKRNAVAAGDQL